MIGVEVLNAEKFLRFHTVDTIFLRISRAWFLWTECMNSEKCKGINSPKNPMKPETLWTAQALNALYPYRAGYLSKNCDSRKNRPQPDNALWYVYELDSC